MIFCISKCNGPSIKDVDVVQRLLHPVVSSRLFHTPVENTITYCATLILSIRWVNLINTYWYISRAGIYSRKTNWHTETSHHNNNNKNKPTFGRRQEPGHRMCHCRGAFVDRTLLKERISFGIRQICQINMRSWWSLKTKRGRGDDGESGGVAGDDDVLVLLLVSQLPHLLDVCLVLQMIRVSEAYFVKPWQLQTYKIIGYSERFLQSLAHFQ